MTSPLVTEKHVDNDIEHSKYWNREIHSKKDGPDSTRLIVSPKNIMRNARIISLSDPNDDANLLLRDPKNLPFGATLLAEGTSIGDFSHLFISRNDTNGTDNDNDGKDIKGVGSKSSSSPNVLFVCASFLRVREVMSKVLQTFPSIEWVHCRSAGIDFINFESLASMPLQVTNAKGHFSSSLAEYAMMACSYFAKDLPRLLRQKERRFWAKYDVEELRGKTMGIIGYGDIGRACAKLANAYGMKIIALRRNPSISVNDTLCDVVYGTGQDSLNRLMSDSDYVVCSMPLTDETNGMINSVAINSMCSHCVFINLGRGKVLDELALVDALKEGRIRGAALDVFTEEPLPEKHELWNLGDNVLISPHNMDQTSSFMHEATDFFVKENLPRFICGKKLLNQVDKCLGY